MTGRTVWFPGHMAKGARKLKELAGKLDLILEVRDARAPEATASPLASSLSKICPVWKILTKKDLADPAVTSKWIEFYRSSGGRAWALDVLKGEAEKIRRDLELKSPSHRELRIAVLGIPNVGKSALLNGLVGKRAASVGAVPGITKGVSWHKGKGFLAVDSPGILDPKSGEKLQRALAWLGCTKADVIGGYDSLALDLIGFLTEKGLWESVKPWGVSSLEDPFDTLEALGRRLGCVLPGNSLDLNLAGKRLLNSFASGKLGPLSLERPGDILE